MSPITLLPVEPNRIDRSDVEATVLLQPRCANPTCPNLATEKHHITRRSYAGARDWVKIDEVDYPNVCGLCRDCHEAITRNKVRISFVGGTYHWQDPLWPSTPLNPHPPFSGKPEVSILAETSERSVCPTCERPFPQPKPETEPERKRERRTWSITVPKDRREDGAEVLTELLEAGREVLARGGLPYGEEDTVKYFVLSTILAIFAQHGDQILSNS